MKINQEAIVDLFHYEKEVSERIKTEYSVQFLVQLFLNCCMRKQIGLACIHSKSKGENNLLGLL
jgi:hypothetical protein